MYGFICLSFWIQLLFFCYDCPTQEVLKTSINNKVYKYNLFTQQPPFRGTR